LVQINTGVGVGAYFTTNNLNNTTCIGMNSGGIVNASNRVEIGNSSVTYIGGQVTWSTYSDGRIKDNVQENIPGLNFIKALRPVTYNLNIEKQFVLSDRGKAALKDKDGKLIDKAINRNQPQFPEQFDIEKITQTGFIAQEVAAAAKKTGYDFSGVDVPKDGKGLYSLRYAEFVVPLVKAVQELDEANKTYQTKIDAQEKKIATLEKELNAIKIKLGIQ
jgi:trimeric autotransporter adhesin